MKTVDTRTVIALFGDAVGEVLGAVLEKQASVALNSTTPEPGYVVVVEARRGGRGMLQIHFDRSDAEALAKRMSGGGGVDPDQAAVLGSLKEVCGQAATTLAEKYPGSGAQLEVASAHVWSESPQWAAATAIEIALEGEPLTIKAEIIATLEILPDGDRAQDETRTGESPNIDVILDIDLPLVVRFGRTEMSLKDLTALGPGSLINLGRSPDDPVDVLVSNQVVARGEVVTVAGSYGVRIRDVVSPAERVRSVEVSL